jgi:Na+-transporting methylmalonyl-CoA/oxaloacetate decarboxylase gamma subunit
MFMLAGHEVGLYETAMVSLLGMGIAMVSLIILMLFIMAFSKALSKKPGISDEELAVIAASVCAETGLHPEQITITSVTPSK